MNCATRPPCPSTSRSSEQQIHNHIYNRWLKIAADIYSGGARRRSFGPTEPGMNTYGCRRALGGHRSALIHLEIGPPCRLRLLQLSSIALQRARKCIRCLIQSDQEYRFFQPKQSSSSSSSFSASLLLFRNSCVAPLQLSFVL